MRLLFLPITLGSLLFLNGSFGSIGPVTDRVAGLVLLIVLALLGGSLLSSRVSASDWLVRSGAIATAVGLGLIVIGERRSAWLFGAAAALGGLWAACRAIRDERAARSNRVVAAAAVGAWAFAAWHQCTVLQAVPWKIQDVIASSLVTMITRLVGSPLSMGVTYSAFAMPLAACLILIVVTKDASLSRQARWMAALVPWGVYAVLLAVAGLVANGRWPFGDVEQISAIQFVMFGVQSAVQAIWLASVSFAVSRSSAPISIADQRSPGSRMARWATLAAVVAAFLVAGREWRDRSLVEHATPRRLIAVTDTPADGFEKGHYYGRFLRLARDLGFETVWTHSYARVDPPAGPGDVVALLFPIAWSAQNESERIVAGVEQGAGLFVVGEHTNAADTADLLRPVLSPLGFRFGFDSVFPAGWPWSRGLALHDHVIADPWRTSLNSRYLVGASVDPPWLGSIATVARYAFGDRGNTDGIPGNQIGDRTYSATDRLGDLPVIASRNFGEGRALVVGDPNFLHDVSLAWSRPIVAQMLRYLAAKSGGTTFDLVVPWSVCLLVLFVAFVLLRRGDANPWTAALLAIATLPGDAVGRRDARGVPEPSGRFVIDVAHQPDISFEESGRKSVIGLVEKLHVDGRDVAFSNELEPRALSGAAGVITIAPNAPIGAAEAARILGFVRDGATWIVAAGVQHAANVAPLLDAAGVDIQPVLMGTAMAWRGDPARDASEGLFREAYALHVRPGSNARPLHVTEAPLVTETKLGAGRIVVIGDPLFLLGGNLGGAGYDIAANNVILQKVLSSS